MRRSKPLNTTIRIPLYRKLGIDIFAARDFAVTDSGNAKFLHFPKKIDGFFAFFSLKTEEFFAIFHIIMKEKKFNTSADKKSLKMG